MRDLTVRLAALSPEAADALRVITYFDELVERGAGLRAVVRGAAVLTGRPAGLDDAGRRLRMRVLPDGSSAAADPPDRSRAAWPTTDPSLGAPVLWVERDGGPGGLDAVVLERAHRAARAVLGSPARGGSGTGGRGGTSGGSGGEGTEEDAAARRAREVAVALDPAAPAGARSRALGRLGLGEGRACVVVTGAGARLVRSVHDARREADGERAGVGPVVPVLDLPATVADARAALRLAAAGTGRDPGPTVVSAEEAGGLLTLARAVGPGGEPEPDVRALARAAADAPHVLATLDAVSRAASLRDAAARLHVHHSTVHDRVARAERLLGWTVTTPDGRLRLQLALVLRRLRRAPAPA